MTKIQSSAAILIVALFASVAAPARAAGVAGAFGQGRTHLTVFGGSGSAYDRNYNILGVGVSHFLVDGLGVGLHVENWSGNAPGIKKATPSVQYVFYQVPNISPYIGTFYRRTFTENLPDLNSYGVRVGIYIAAGRNAHIGVGVVRETSIDCNEALYVNCSDTYQEISMTFRF